MDHLSTYHISRSLAMGSSVVWRNPINANRHADHTFLAAVGRYVCTYTYIVHYAITVNAYFFFTFSFLIFCRTGDSFDLNCISLKQSTCKYYFVHILNFTLAGYPVSVCANFTLSAFPVSVCFCFASASYENAESNSKF